jgi:3-phenylpropionate/trans-cinnamate dioxygenase ferredoxin subunit
LRFFFNFLLLYILFILRAGFYLNNLSSFWGPPQTVDILEGTIKGITINGKDIIIARVDGKYYAASGRCPHMKAYLSKSKLKGTIVTCPMHGSQFDLKTGKVVRWLDGSGFKTLMGKLMSILGIAARNEKPLTVYEVKIEDNLVMLKLP